MRPAVSTSRSLDRPLDRQRAVLDVAEKPNFSRPPPFRDRDRVLLLGDVESHEDFAYFPMARPPCMRLGSACPSNLVLTCTKGRATRLAREHDF
jgi:hypothetical protein